MGVALRAGNCACGALAAPLARRSADAAQMSCVAVVHEVVAHGCSETYADGLSFAVPKPVPRIVSTAPWETGALSGERK